MKRIYLVMATWDYHDSSNVRAFADKGRADAFCDKCVTHHAKRPWAPPQATDAEFEKWKAKDARWEKQHPAGEGMTTADSFGVYPVNFDPKAAP